MPGNPLKVLVINPNSNAAVTAGISAALAAFRRPEGPEILCETLAEGPFGIESQADIEAVVPPLRRLVAGRPEVAAFVIACYSDPGLRDCREATTRPVFGIQECALRTACARGERFGVIALSEASIRRHLRYQRELGLNDRLAGERAVALTVAESGEDGDSFERLLNVGRDLRDHDRADTIILGCAGMACHRGALEAILGVPVIDPTQAAVAMALEAVLTAGSAEGVAASG